MILSWRAFVVLFFAASVPGVRSANDCQPYQWKRDTDRIAYQWERDTSNNTYHLKRAAGDVTCRYWATSPASVNYYTCTELALKYGETVETFFLLNPTVDKDCAAIRPNTDYCIKGYIEPTLSTDGFCGPNHGNTSCAGETPCCNAQTWKCGGTAEDCAPGTCYSGPCKGGSGYSFDGKCGPKNGGLKCGGRWGDCCNFDGVCGTGPDFCGAGKCESGNCTNPGTLTSIPGVPWQTGSTPDGTCGGALGYTCDVIYGNCCNKDGACGSLDSDCGAGCQPDYGSCSGVTLTSTSATSTSTSSATSTGTSGTTTTTSSASTPTSTGPVFVPSYHSFTLAGCYKEPDGARALTNSYTDANMTVEKCIDVAAAYAWAGIEYGQECWYGNTLNSGATKRDLSAANCGFLCPGNSNEYCGAGNHLVLYNNPSAAQPTQPGTVNGKAWYGCVTEATNMRALSAATYASDSMTLESCAGFCGEYKYFGVEYARECYCGNSFNAGSVMAPASDCNMLCSGNNLQYCGAGNRLSVYGG